MENRRHRWKEAGAGKGKKGIFEQIFYAYENSIVIFPFCYVSIVIDLNRYFRPAKSLFFGKIWTSLNFETDIKIIAGLHSINRTTHADVAALRNSLLYILDSLWNDPQFLAFTAQSGICAALDRGTRSGHALSVQKSGTRSVSFLIFDAKYEFLDIITCSDFWCLYWTFLKLQNYKDTIRALVFRLLLECWNYFEFADRSPEKSASRFWRRSSAFWRFSDWR